MGRLTLAGFWVLPRLEAAFRAEALADFRDFRFASVERSLARMNGVIAEHELVRMLDGRAEDKARVFARFKIKSPVRLFEHRQLALVYDLRRCQLSSMHGDPGDRVIVRWLVTPFLALRERHVQIVHRRRRGHLTRGFTEAAKDDARRTVRLETLAPEVLCFGFYAFHLRRKSDPQLIALDAHGPHRAPGMPYAAACAHPFDAPRLDDAFRAGGFLIGDLPLENERKRRDAGMRMKADRRHALRVDEKIIQEHEGLDQLAHVGRTDEPRDGPMRISARTVDDAASAGFGSGFGEWPVHECSLRLGSACASISCSFLKARGPKVIVPLSIVVAYISRYKPSFMSIDA